MSTAEDLTIGSSHMAYSIVVCTKNRPTEIKNFLKALNSQESEFLEKTIVVDGSYESEAFTNLNKELDLHIQNNELVFLKTNGGKPAALNLAKEYLINSSIQLDAVVFLDDDISFRLEDLEKGIFYLKQNKKCGLSPMLVNEGDFCFRNRFRNQMRLFDKESGELTRAGDNHWVNYRSVKEEWLDTDWLPGGAAIFDWSKIRNINFNEELENPKLMGYALGDDVDFSIRASQHGDLGCLQSIQVIHSPPSSSYRNPIMIAIARGRWKAFLVTEYPEKFSKISVIATEIIRSLGRAIFRAKPITSFRYMFHFLREFFKYSFGTTTGMKV